MPWSHEYLGIPEAWHTSEGEGVRVAVLDTGVDRTHPDLNGSIVGAFDTTGQGPLDRDTHGTWCCGIICGENNDEGIVGIAPKAEVISVKVLGDDGTGYGEWIAKGIELAEREGADIISMSLGSTFEMPEITEALRQFCYKPNRAAVCAAGNDGWNDPNGLNWPAACSFSQAIAAIDRDGNIADFSSRGPGVTVAAPGVDILSTVPGGLYAKMSGTSMATPIVAGVVALMRASGVSWQTPEELTERLMSTARDIGEPGVDEDSGAGIIDPSRLLAKKAAASSFNLGPFEFVYPIPYNGEKWWGVRWIGDEE